MQKFIDIYHISKEFLLKLEKNEIEHDFLNKYKNFGFFIPCSFLQPNNISSKTNQSIVNLKAKIHNRNYFIDLLIPHSIYKQIEKKISLIIKNYCLILTELKIKLNIKNNYRIVFYFSNSSKSNYFF